MNGNVKILDCTLRDGGYYTDWDFSPSLVQDYFSAMLAVNVDFVEIGLRSLEDNGYKGGYAYSSDSFIRSLNPPSGLKIGVMINASELLKTADGIDIKLQKLFTHASSSPVTLVRLACHLHEFEAVLPACTWLKNQGYMVGANLMQIADRSDAEIQMVANLASQFPLDVLYFADSMGSMLPSQMARVISILRKEWSGPIGVHTHDNMGHALANCAESVAKGATWIDGTVTGMGRGPGNVKTESLIIEFEDKRNKDYDLSVLLNLIHEHFLPMQHACGWGTNTYYFLAGKYGIHPTYIQEMLTDSRFNSEDILAVIQHLRDSGGKSYNSEALEAGRRFYNGPPKGNWVPKNVFKGKDILILGTGPGLNDHKIAIESYISKTKPIVIALNTQTVISSELIDFRAACHPIRLLADCDVHRDLPQPLITPVSMLPPSVITALGDKPLMDFGLVVKPNTFEFAENYCIAPTSLVIAYVFALASSGEAASILLAGFDGYPAGDKRNAEMESILTTYSGSEGAVPIKSITRTVYPVTKTSVYCGIN